MARPILASVCDDLTHEASSSSTMSARFCSGTEEQLLGHRHQNESHEGRAGQRTGRRNVTGNRKLRRIMSNTTRLGAAAKSRNKVATCAPTVWPSTPPRRSSAGQAGSQPMLARPEVDHPRADGRSPMKSAISKEDPAPEPSDSDSS